MGKMGRAEFYSGKGIAKTTIVHNELPVSFFNIHLLSRKGKDADLYMDRDSLDRMSELFEIFTQVVEQADSDAFVLVGDFNMNIYNREFNFFKKFNLLKWGHFKKQTKKPVPIALKIHLTKIRRPVGLYLDLPKADD